jgi:putative toxin-antitoxin system antitoxin component (TIGR02293 family)
MTHPKIPSEDTHARDVRRIALTEAEPPTDLPVVKPDMVRGREKVIRANKVKITRFETQRVLSSLFTAADLANKAITQAQGGRVTTADREKTAKGPDEFPYLSVYRASPLERISLIKKGIPASEVKRLFVDLPIGQGVGFKALNLSVATVNKKAKEGGVLSSDESERVIGLERLVGQLEAIIQESGDPPGFDARAWMARWLTEPLPAFGGRRPVDLIDTMEGQSLVSAALAKLQSGAYA